MGNKCIPEIRGQRTDKMFQKHLSSPSGVYAPCYPDLTGSMKGDDSGTQEASCWYFQTEACLTGRREGWLENQPGWGRRDRKCWGEHPLSIDVLEVLNSCVVGNSCPSSTACVCVLAGCVQPWSWAYPACLGTCAFVSLSRVGPSLLREMWMAAAALLSIGC